MMISQPHPVKKNAESNRSRSSIDSALELSSGAAAGTLLAGTAAGLLANTVPILLGGPILGGILGAVAGRVIGDYIQSHTTMAQKRALAGKRKQRRQSQASHPENT